jgi:phosphonate transport system permease protein
MTEISHYSQVWTYRSPRARLALWGGWLALVALFVWCWQLMTKDTIWFFVAGTRRGRPPISAAAWCRRAGSISANSGCRSGTRSTSRRWARWAGSSWRCRWPFWRPATPRPRPRFLRPIALFIIVASRSINSLIWALLLVAIIGPGLLAGIVAIALRSIGFVGKLLYEAIEETDATQIEAIEATGASGAQVLNYGIVPQIMPAFWGITVFRWDINIRESTILGLVGAGGIGLKLQASLNTLAWSQVSVILLLILATVVLSEWVSARMRHAII